MSPKQRAVRPRPSSTSSPLDPDFLDPTLPYRREPANHYRRWHERHIEEEQSFRLDVLRAAGLLD